jgi:two-component system chemotaxis response regulator CheB
LDDGMAGLAAIRSSGGVTIVQDPEEAKFSGMPRNAQRHADHVLPVRQITPLLEELTRLEPGVR